MDLPHASQLSISQLIQTIAPHLASLTVSWVTFQVWIGAMLDFLAEEKIKTQIWIKLPIAKSWIEAIDDYHELGNSELIFLCHSPRDETQIRALERSRFDANLINNQRVFLKLETNYHLQQEFLFLVISSQWCCLSAAEQLSDSPQLKMFFSDDLEIITPLLAALQEVITITDHTPERLLTETVMLSDLNYTLDHSQLTKLLLKQIQRSESLVNQEIKPANQVSPASVTPSPLINAEFLAKLVAQLRTSITHTKTALSLLTSKEHYQRQQPYLSLLQQECDRQNALATRLLELSQLEWENLSTHTTSIEEIVLNIISIYQPLAEEKGIQLGYNIPVGFPPINCSANVVRQIFINLLDNSLKFTKNKGKIYVKVSLNKQSIELIIADTGIGIAPEDLDKIFDSFYQGQNIASEHQLSAGLGLTIVRQLLAACGGSIKIKSKVDHGCVVKVTFP